MYELIVYPKPKDSKLINNSPFCAKSEIFLRLNKIEHKVVDFLGNPGKFLKSKLPVLMDNGNEIADSTFIQKYLVEKTGIDMDSHLTQKQWAEGYAFCRMTEEFLYWVILHERWFVDENWIKLRNDYFSHIPRLIVKPVAGMIRKTTKKSAIGHGMSRHSDEEVYYHGVNCIKSISVYLGEKQYFLGDKVSSFDTTIYAFLASVLYSSYGPRMKEESSKYDNLKAYCERMHKLVFGS